MSENYISIIPSNFIFITTILSISIFVICLASATFLILNPKPLKTKIAVKATRSNLIKALSKREKYEQLLSSLNNLKEKNSIGEEYYRIFSSEYTKSYEQACEVITSIKEKFKTELKNKLFESNDIRNMLNILENRFKIEQIDIRKFKSNHKSLQNKLAKIDKEIFKLSTLIKADKITDITKPPVVITITPEFNNKIEATVSTTLQPTDEINKQPAKLTPNIEDIKVKYEPALKITDIQILPNIVTIGNSVGVIARVRNKTNNNVNERLELKINGETVDLKNLFLAPEETQEITFIIDAKNIGEHSVEINDKRGNFRVVAP